MGKSTNGKMSIWKTKCWHFWEKNAEVFSKGGQDHWRGGHGVTHRAHHKGQAVAQRQEMVIGTPALLWYFVMLAVMWAGQWIRRESEETKSCRIGGIFMSICPSVHPSLHPSVPSPPGPSEADPGHTDSPCSTGLCLLWFPPEPLPCSRNCYHYKIPEQGKGTDDHLLPLGDWLLIMFKMNFAYQ